MFRLLSRRLGYTLIEFKLINIFLYIRAISVCLILPLLLFPGAMPWWLLTVGTGLFDDIVIPWETIGKNWGVFVCPWLGGMLLQYLVPKCKGPISKILFPTNAIQLILALITGIFTNFYQFRFWNARNVIAGMLIPYGTLAVALLTAWGFGFSKEDILATGFTTPLKDGGLVISVIHHAIHGPYADIWMAPVLVSSLVTPYVIIPYVIYIRCYREGCRKAYLKKKGLDPKALKENADKPEDNKVAPHKGEASHESEVEGVENEAYDKTEM